jgi:hypothetical protein
MPIHKGGRARPTKSIAKPALCKDHYRQLPIGLRLLRPAMGAGFPRLSQSPIPAVVLTGLNGAGHRTGNRHANGHTGAAAQSRTGRDIAPS